MSLKHGAVMFTLLLVYNSHLFIYVVVVPPGGQVFFVIRLQPLPTDPTTSSPTPPPPADLPEIRDPDPLMSNELMDGRDAFLTLAREKHYEFSSLRRAKYSTMGMLYELHAQAAKDSFVRQCSECRASVETRYHCATCDVSAFAMHSNK